MAAQGLNENQGLIGFAILANIALAFLIVPLVGLSGLAFSNGQLVPNREPSLAVIMISFCMQTNHLELLPLVPWPHQFGCVRVSPIELVLLSMYVEPRVSAGQHSWHPHFSRFEPVRAVQCTLRRRQLAAAEIQCCAHQYCSGHQGGRGALETELSGARL